VGITYFSTEGGTNPLHATIVATASEGHWGHPPGLGLIHGLTSNPVLLASNSHLSGGILDASVDLVDLPLDPDRLSVLGNIPTSHGDQGAGKHCDIDGKIVKGVPGQWFQVTYTGSWSHTVTYRIEAGKIVPEEQTGDLYTHCPPEAEPADLATTASSQ
jgi:hypothetical protein